VSSTPGKSDWQNSVFLTSVDDIKKLKDSDGSDLHVIGSSVLVQTLLKHDLVDELVLMMFPITLGSGKRLFREGTMPAGFKMTDSLVTKNGVIFVIYERAGDVETGTVGA
jgi:dihydrofolate reductase